MRFIHQQNAGQSATTASIPIHGADGVPSAELHRLLTEKSRCVRFEYCVSVLVVTFRCQSSPYLIDRPQSRFWYGLAYSLMALAFGPWGVPWGPIQTARAIWVNLRGGEDVTALVLSRLGGEPTRD